MSGLTIVQNGNPVEVDLSVRHPYTHVLINDPTRGYGIFIENMLNAA